MEDNHDDDSITLEEEVEIELSKICISSLEVDDPDIDSSTEASSDSEPISDELPDSVLHYLNFVKARSQNAERLLQDLDNDDMLRDTYNVVPNSASDCLTELASEYNEDPEELKKRVLSEIEDEELQIDTETENADEVNNNGSILSNETVDAGLLTDDNDMAISFSFQEVEAKCKQEYEIWLEQQKDVEDDKMKKLKEEREMEKMENEMERDKRQKRQEELEAERTKLEMLHAQQQAILDEALQKEEEAWKEQLMQHNKLIQNLHMQIEEEQMAFEEQRTKERQQMAEQQNMAAQKIQASFRAFRVYKTYAPVLKEWRAELKRKRDLQEEIKMEQREKEERLRKRALEKKQKEEEERKRQEEKEREEIAEGVKRCREYELKKELVRRQREQLILLEQKRREKDSLNGFTEWKMEPENTDKQVKMTTEEQEIGKVKEDSKAEEIPRRTVTENRDQDMEVAEKVKVKKVEEEEERTSKMESEMAARNMEEDLEIAKKEGETGKVNEQKNDTAEERKQILQKQQIKLTQEIRLKKEEQDSLWHNDGGEKQTSGKTEFLNEINNDDLVEKGVLYVEDCGSATADCQMGSNTRMLGIKMVVPADITIVDEESGAQSNHVSMNVLLSSGESGQTDQSYASENLKIEPTKKESQSVDDLWARRDLSIKPFEKPNIPYDSIEEKRLMWMKTCKSWSSICGENKRKKTVERGKPRKCSASSLPPLNAAMIIQAGPWNTLQQVTTVTFEDLPGCSLSTLSQCSRLQFLSLRRCGLIALEGLGSCKDLMYIDVEENNIQTISCENLENLCILILNKNRISSIHGLYGCSNLLNLEFSYNKIARIALLLNIWNAACSLLEQLKFITNCPILTMFTQKEVPLV